MNDQDFDEEDDHVREEHALAKAALRSRKPWYENGMWIWVMQGAILFVLAILTGYVTLWMDTHNDVRYVPRTEYKRDYEAAKEKSTEENNANRRERDTIRALALQDKQDLGKILDRQQLQLDTIASDIKSLLRRNP